jgi:translation initiation factor IF-3
VQKFRINHQIQAPEVRLLTDEGEQLGIFSLSEAMKIGEEHGLDLVEISPNAKPPVVKLIGYDKFRYQQKKMEQQQKKNAKKVEVKVLRISTRIGEHDMKVKAKKADEFLTDGDLVKIELRMRGREQAFADVSEKQLHAFLGLITATKRIEIPVKRMGNTISVTLAPTK